ncbi:hypothetical protein F4824DRAFT_505922 [Ustulina deusta]|nr:hypothetical protein F4824DRAFT_505922 [Ustulina deusta]
MDCRTTYVQEASGITTANPDKPNAQIMDAMRRSVQRHNCVNDAMSVYQVADWLREQGVLAGDSNCIPITYYFQLNFEMAKGDGRFETAMPLSTPNSSTYFTVRVFEMMYHRPEDRPADWLGPFQRTLDPAADKGKLNKHLRDCRYIDESCELFALLHRQQEPLRREAYIKAKLMTATNDRRRPFGRCRFKAANDGQGASGRVWIRGEKGAPLPGDLASRDPGAGPGAGPAVRARS